ncbi:MULTISPECIES: TRZ/ATZ family hydrolase [unclassified Marinimicrobium]|jgi:5-methylthioadenosine/S-adenosylhomocysteine deaminase|uniref:TRZ/ATZ family hydrolase n=1 Tax=unclassified Marinimicrobium TaxID=2632100 RepID=UPI00257A9E05|nr:MULTISPECIES: TRZ/ATZ family hydrolase [unclassified Marinimicrobium]
MSAPQTVSLIIKARWIAPVVPENRVFEHCALVVDKGVIQALVPQEEADKRYDAQQEIFLGNHLLIPGLVNAHGHAAMSLLRGYADDLPLKQWLEGHIWPAEDQWLSEDMVRDGTELAMAEMIRSGTTCFSDMYFFPEQVAQAAQQAHMRAQVNFPVFDAPSAWGQGPEDYFRKGLALHDDFRASELVRIGFGPHAPYTLSDEPLTRIATLAQELDAPIHIHLHETAQEVSDSIEQYGKRPIQRLAELGLLSPLTQCVHMTQVDEGDIELIRDSGAQVVHCPESNLKLASGFCPAQRLLDEGINVALGTDGAASNNDLDLLSEMKTAALLAKAVAGRADALDAHSALRMATLNGARALGLDEHIGSLEVGKSADITAIELSDLPSQPVYHPVSQLVYTNCGHKVSHVWVAGKALLLSRQLQTLNERELIGKARWWAKQIKGQH